MLLLVTYVTGDREGGKKGGWEGEQEGGRAERGDVGRRHMLGRHSCFPPGHPALEFVNIRSKIVITACLQIIGTHFFLSSDTFFL